MGVQNFDVEFEDYIIFHRGVQEVFINPDNNHLCVTYQDGYVQDLGDPLGDRVSQAMAAGEYAAQVEQMIRSKESEINTKLDSATVLSADANVKYQDTMDIGAQVKNGKEYVDNQIAAMLENGIDGIEKDNDTGKYYIDLTDYSTTNGVKSLINNDILKINGVEAYQDTYGNNLYYLNPVKDSSRTTTAINNMISDRLQDIDGVVWNPDLQKYEVDLSNDAVTGEEISALFL